jgi:toxin ParE1/3/4
MAHELRFRPAAVADLDDIYHAVLRLSASRVVAERYVARIRERCRRITILLFGGRLREDLAPGLRTVPHERHVVIVYRVVAPAMVEITNIFYSGRDYAALYRSGANRDPEHGAG